MNSSSEGKSSILRSGARPAAMAVRPAAKTADVRRKLRRVTPSYSTAAGLPLEGRSGMLSVLLHWPRLVLPRDEADEAAVPVFFPETLANADCDRKRNPGA